MNSYKMNNNKLRVKSFNNFWIHCGLFVPLKYSYERNSDKKITDLSCPKCKKISSKKDYDPFIGISLISDWVRKIVVGKNNEKRLNEIKDAIKKTGWQINILNWSLCNDMLDDQDWLMCNFWNVNFWGSWLLDRLRKEETWPHCNKTLKREDVSSNTEWKDKIRMLLNCQTNSNKNGWNQSSLKEDDKTTTNQFINSANFFYNPDDKDRVKSSWIKRVRFAEDVKFQDPSNDYQKIASVHNSQSNNPENYLEKNTAIYLPLLKLAEEAKVELNKLVKQLSSNVEKKFSKVFEEYSNKIDKITNEKLSPVNTSCQKVNEKHSSDKIEKEESKESSKNKTNIKKEEIIEINEDSEFINNEVINSFGATLNLSFDNFKNSNPETAIILDSPIQIEAILKKVSKDEWELSIKQLEQTNAEYKCLTKMIKSSSIKVIYPNTFEIIKPDQKSTQVAKLILTPGTDISNVKGYLSFHFDFILKK